METILEEPAPTPVLAYLAHSDERITGVTNLTVSHNRFTDNGFKFSPHLGGAADEEVTNLISKYAYEASVQKKLSRLLASWKVKSVITLDGLKVVLKMDDWFCVRLSETENAARLYAEATDKEKHSLLHHAATALLGIASN